MGLGEIFIITFLIGLSGAMSPGALLSYTLYQSIQDSKHSLKTGLLISLGHAIVELFPITVILLGFGRIFQNSTVTSTIGILGSVVLINVLFVISQL